MFSFSSAIDLFNGCTYWLYEPYDFRPGEDGTLSFREIEESYLTRTRCGDLNFVDWDRPAVGGYCGWEYEVLYFKRGIKLPMPYDRGDLRMTYGLRYCIDEDGGPGYVHLAGRNDRFGPENIHTVW